MNRELIHGKQLHIPGSFNTVHHVQVSSRVDSVFTIKRLRSSQ